MKHITLNVTVADETRPVEFMLFKDESPVGYSAPVFAGRIGAGTKRHAVEVMIVRLDDATNPNVARGYGASSRYTDADGVVWGLQSVGHTLNREARVTGWFSAADGNHNSQHVGSYK